MLVFVGDGFDSVPALDRVKNLLTDFFRGKEVSTINLAGLDHCICVTLRPTDGKGEISVSDDGQTVRNATVLLRHYAVALMRSGTKVPKVELTSVGPTLDLEVRRCQLATPERFKHACRLPKELISRARKQKNITVDKLGDKYGQVHVRAQTGDLMGKLGTRKFKAFRQRRRDAAAAAADAADGDGGGGGGGNRGFAAALPGGEAGPAVPAAKRRRRSGGGGGAMRVYAAADDAL